MLSRMRIGTWNLDGKWSDRHADFLRRHDCDVWLLTEVRADVQLDRYERAVTKLPMTPDRHWSAILSRIGLAEQKAPHPTTARAIVGDTTYWCSVLPWRTCGEQTPWVGSTHADKVAALLSDLELARPDGRLVWGGDWNQALTGRDYAGSTDGRRHLLATVDSFKLHVPTAGLRHQLPGHASIDHIALPQGDLATRITWLAANDQRGSLSDHDAYIVDIDPGPLAIPIAAAQPPRDGGRCQAPQAATLETPQ
jgi:Endonuclease/Exonuclease/phosphatase family